MNKWVPALLLAALLTGVLGRMLYQQFSASHAQLDAQAQLVSGQQLQTLFRADGKIRILYFGFTRCPDICPTSLAVLAGALHQLTPEQLEQVVPIFISVDSEFDDGQRAADYARYFHPNIIGMGGSKTQIDAISQPLGVFYQKTQLTNSAMGYTMDHTSMFYLLDADANLLTTVAHTNDPQDVLTALLPLLAGSKP